MAGRLYREGVFGAKPDQVIINEYLPGQGIAAYVDCEAMLWQRHRLTEPATICMMEFSSLRQSNSLSLYLEPQSLLILKDEARLSWKHGITARKSDLIGGRKTVRGRRVSLTFRSVVLDAERKPHEAPTSRPNHLQYKENFYHGPIDRVRE